MPHPSPHSAIEDYVGSLDFLPYLTVMRHPSSSLLRVREVAYWRVRTFITVWYKEAKLPHYGAIGGHMGGSNEALLPFSAKEVPVEA